MQHFFNTIIELIYEDKKLELRNYLKHVDQEDFRFLDIFVSMKLFEEMRPGDENNDARYLIYKYLKDAYPEKHFETFELINSSKVRLVNNLNTDKSILKKYLQTQITPTITSLSKAELIHYALKLKESRIDLFDGAEGILVMEVRENSQGSAAGFLKGDIITHYSGQPINTVNNLVHLTNSIPSDSQVTLNYIRADKLNTVKLKGGKIGIIISNISIELELSNLLEEGINAYKIYNYRLAMKKWQTGLERALETNHENETGDFFSNIGTINFKMRHYEKALSLFHQALKVQRKIGNKRSEAVALNNIAGIYNELKEYEQSLNYYKKALEINREVSAKQNMDGNLFNITKIYMQLGQFRDALPYCELALENSKEIGDKNTEISYLRDLSGIHSMLGNINKAEEYFAKALEGARELNDKNLELGILINLAFHTERQKQFEKAYNHYQKALIISRKIKDSQSEKTLLDAINRMTETIIEYLSKNSDDVLLNTICKKYPLFIKTFIYRNIRLLYASKFLGRKSEYDIIKIIAKYNQTNPYDIIKKEELFDPLNGHIVDRTFYLHVVSFLNSDNAMKTFEKLVSLNKDLTEVILHDEIDPENLYNFPEKTGNTSIHAIENDVADVVFNQPNNKHIEIIQDLSETYQRLFGGDYFVLNLNKTLQFKKSELKKIYYAKLVEYLAGIQKEALRYNWAMEYYEKAKEIYFQFGLLKNVLDVQLKQARIHLYQGDFEKANSFFIDCEEQYISINCKTCVFDLWKDKIRYYTNLFSNNIALSIAKMTLNSLKDNYYREPVRGVLLHEIGRLKNELIHGDAIDYLNQALITLSSSNLIEKKLYEAKTLFEIAKYYEQQNDVLSARRNYNKAIETVDSALQKSTGGGATIITRTSSQKFGKRFTGQDHSLLKKLILNHLGLMLLKSGEYDLGWDTLNSSGDPGVLCEAMIEYDKSEDDVLFTCQDLFLRGSEAVNDYKAMIVAYSFLGDYYNNQEKFIQALEYYQKAIDISENKRIHIDRKELKSSFIIEKQRVYDEAILILKKMNEKYPNKGYDRKALEIFELRQGRIFLEEMGKSGARRFAGLPEDIRNKENNLEKEINNMDLNTNNKKRVREINIALKKIQEEIKLKYPDYYALKYPKPISAIEFQESVLQPGEVMLVYAVMKKQTCLWTISKNHFSLTTIKSGIDVLTKKVERYRNKVISLSSNLRGRVISLKDNLEKDGEIPDLYTLLVPDGIRKTFSDAEMLYIIPTGPLYLLPFESLKTEKAQYLIENHPIAYLSSVSLLKILRDSQARKKEIPTYPLLAFANPVYEKQSLKTKNNTFLELRTRSFQSFLGGQFAELPETEDEVRAIKNILNAPDESKPLWLKKAATRSNIFKLNITEKLDDYRYIVFACHGILPNEVNRITQPALVLSNPEKEGYLTMGDVFGIKLNANLVTLSACNTGLGKEIKGEGIMGLSRAFMYAGTSAVTVTLWSVESQSAKNINVGLFQNIKNGKSLAEALREIKIKLIRSKNYKHPFYWAPVVIFGDGQ